MYYSTIDESDEKKKPEIIQFYNATKEDVDAVDEMSSSYSSVRKTNRLQLVDFCCILYVLTINTQAV